MTNTTFFFIALLGIFTCLVWAGDDCPIMKPVENSCSCSQYRMDLPDRGIPEIEQISTPGYTTAYSSLSKWAVTAHASENMHFKSIAATTAPKIRDPKYYTVIDCNLMNASRATIFEDLADVLNRKWVDKLRITNLPLDRESRQVRFPVRWLEDTRITQLQIENTVLAGDFFWPEQLFDAQMHSLIWLAAINCSLTGVLSFDSFGTVHLRGLEKLQHLEGLDLSGNYLLSIENATFPDSMSELKSLILSRNVLESVQAGAFHNISKLTYIDLSHNLLFFLNRSIFSSYPSQLKKINLSWNRFKALPEDLFDNMTALKWVDFSNNFLYSLQQKPWEGIWDQLEWIDVSNNFIQCNCDLLWLVKPDRNETLAENKLVRGQCGLTLPSMYVHHFDLDSLKLGNLACGDLDTQLRFYGHRMFDTKKMQ